MKNVENEDLIKSACEYAALGWPVFPVVGKQPAGCRWKDRATADIGLVAPLFREFSGDGIGIIVSDGAIVIDIDPPADSKMIALRIGAHAWDGPVASTPRGGFHFFGKDPRPDGARGNRTARLPAGIDIRGGGLGYVVVPPLNGADFGDGRRWITPLGKPNELSVCPENIAEKLMEGSPPKPQADDRTPSTKAGAKNPGKGAADHSKYVAAALAAETHAVANAQKGGRNAALNTSALKLGTLAIHGLRRVDAESALIGAAISAGLDEIEAQKTFDSGWTAGVAQPREISAPTKSRRKIARKKIAEAGLARSDLGNAARLKARCGEDLRYASGLGWLVWTDGQRWKAVGKDALPVMARAEETAKSIFLEAHACSGEKQASLARWAIASQSAARLESMIKLARHKIETKADDMDADPWSINCFNGTLNLRTGELRAHRREDMITKIAPVRYDSEATSPLWKRNLETILPDPEVRHFVHKAVGYSATGNCREEIFFVPHGKGRNGKSKFLGAIEHVLGDYSGTAPQGLFVATRDKNADHLCAGLHGTRFVTAIETGEGRRLDEELVKILTGRDRISARLLYHEAFSFEPSHKLWLATNHKPIVRGSDFAFWRRIALIPFEVRIPDNEIDRDLPEKLQAEAPGILRWIVEGCLLWQKEGLDFPQAVRAATADYRKNSDIIGDFLDTKTIINPNVSTPAKEIFKIFNAWCDEAGERYLSQRILGLKLSERGFRREHTRAGWSWLGLQLQSDAPTGQATMNLADGNDAGGAEYYSYD